MKRIFIFFILLTSLPCVSFASGDKVVAGARSLGMGGISVTQKGLWSVYNNQAGLASVRTTTVGVHFANRYLLGGLSDQVIGLAVPVKFGTLGASFYHFGNANYNELKAGLAYARSFGEHFSFGLQLDYWRFSLAEDYGNKTAVTFEAGIQAMLTDDLCLGAQVYNPIRAKISEYADERIPLEYRLGLSYAISSNFTAAAEVSKEEYFGARAHAGIEYLFGKGLYARAGFISNPSEYTFGFGLKLSKLQIDFATGIHSTLGYSPSVSMFYSF